MAKESIKDKTVKGVAWSGIDNVMQYGVTFLVGIVLARLLSPDDYGLIGITSIFTAICYAFIGCGLVNALIRKKDATDEDYSTAFIVNIGMSILLYLIIFVSAPFIASFFNRHELIDLIRVSSLGMIIGALSMVQQIRLTKKIDFKTQTIITAIASMLSGIVGIGMALIGFGVWALVAQSLTSQGIRTILLWIANKWIPKMAFSSKSFNELFGFGWKIMISNLLNTIWMDLYQVIVGKFYSPATLGQYTRAKSFAKLFSSNITAVVQRVTFPVLSNIQDEKTMMVSAYRRIIKVTMFITAICMFFLGAISEPFLFCLIGPKWHEATIYLPLICISGSLYPLHAINLNMIQVLGRSDLYLGLEIIKKAIGVIPLVVCVFYGILPMLYVNIFTSIIAYFLNSFYSGKFIGYSSLMQLRDVFPSYFIAIVISLSVYFLKYIPVSYWIILPCQLLLGIAIFFIVCKLFRVEEYDELKSIVGEFIKKRSKNKNKN